MRKLDLRLWKRSIKFLYQRLTRGWDDSQTWSLDHTLGKIIAPRLKRMKEISIAHPAELTEKEWADQLDKMIAAFEFAGSDARWSASPEEYEKHQEGIDLFARFYFSLWW